MTKILHTADWQLGKAYGQFVEGRKASDLQQARWKAVEELVRLANAHKVDAVLVCGDLFDSPHPSRSLVCQALEWIGKIGCEVFVIPGNHDHGGPGTLWHKDFFEDERKTLATNLTVLLRSEARELDRFVLLPCPVLERRAGVNPLSLLARPETWAALPRSKSRVVMAHGAVRTFCAESEREGLADWLDLSLIPEDEVDYVALGDWHGMGQVTPRAWYSGTLEADRFPRSADYRAGFALLVTLSGRGEQIHVEACKTGQLEWVRKRLELDAGTGLEPLEKWLESTIGTRVKGHVLRLELEGSLELGARNGLEKLLERFEARALDFKTVNRVVSAPSASDLHQLTARPGDPVIAAVAKQLYESLQQGDNEVDRSALFTLYQLTQHQEKP